MRALDAGDIEALRRKYGNEKAMPGFKFSEANLPSLVIKARR
jgi:hypothetical protein